MSDRPGYLAKYKLVRCNRCRALFVSQARTRRTTCPTCRKSFRLTGVTCVFWSDDYEEVVKRRTELLSAEYRPDP